MENLVFFFHLKYSVQLINVTQLYSYHEYFYISFISTIRYVIHFTNSRTSPTFFLFFILSRKYRLCVFDSYITVGTHYYKSFGPSKSSKCVR